MTEVVTDYRDDVRRIYEIAGRMLGENELNFPNLHLKTLDARIGIAGNDTRDSVPTPQPKILTVLLPFPYSLIRYAWVQQTAGTVYITWSRRNNQDGNRPSDEDGATGKWKRIKIQDDTTHSRLAIQINWPFKATMDDAVLEWDNWVVAYRVILPTA